jgi:aspartate aminotransferase
MPTPAPNAENMPRSGIRAVMDLAWTLPDVIGLHVGEPSFATPGHIVEAGREALARGETRYVPNAGIPPLREAAARRARDRHGLRADAERVVISAGGMQALHLAFSVTVRPGDDVLVPDPGWPNFAMALRLLGANPVRYPLRPEHGFLPDTAELAAAVTDRTRAIVVNSPSNPIGSVLTPELAGQLCRFADRHDLWLISDECYDAFTFGTEHVSPGRFDEQDRVISCFSLSKTYAMTGMRVGYLLAPDERIAAVAQKLQEPLLSCVSAPAQYAGLAALTGPQDEVEHMRDTYAARRDAAAGLLDRLGRGYLYPRGAFYLWLDVRDLCGGDVQAWALEKLRATGVATAPGTAFGPRGEGWVRVSLATGTEALLEGLRRLVA